MEPLKFIQFFNDGLDEEGLTREQRENIFLWMMYESALCEVGHQLKDCPTDKQILDHLFKGSRRFNDVRAAEARLIDLIDQKNGELLKLAMEIAAKDQDR